MNEFISSSEKITPNHILTEIHDKCRISISRSAIDSHGVEARYGLVRGQTLFRKIKNRILSQCLCSLTCFMSFITSVFPILRWLPKYQRQFIIPDLVSGFTASILHIPQGMAYGVLASVNAENGLYMAIFPVVIYFVLGTSKHVSIGTFAVISLMVNSAVAGVNSEPFVNSNFTRTNVTESVTIVDLRPTNLEIVTSLALTVGFLQLIMGIAHLGTLSVLLSDQLVSGFCTGAAVHVATAMIPEVFGIKIRRYSGALKLVYMYIDIFNNITKSNVATIVVAAIAMFVLACVKEQINNRFKEHLKLPIPIDLIVVIIATAISYFFDFQGRYKINVIGLIPTGLPPPVLPPLHLIAHVLSDAFAIAVVAFVTTLSMAKLFAKKHHYTVNANQELLALGCANMFASFFSCFPCSAALARSLVQERSGGKTQVASLVSACILLLVILFLSPLFFSLPRCILSAVILVALKGMFLQVNEFMKAWKIAKIDAMIWMITMLSTVILDVSYGLLAGVVFSIVTVLLRTVFPSSSFLGNIDGTELYLDLERFTQAKEIKGVKIFCFQSALNFINREAFKTSLQEGLPILICDKDYPDAFTKSDDKIHHIIVDCSSLSYVDMSGLEALKEITEEYNELGITVFLAGCSVTMWHIMKMKDIFKKMPELKVFPTVHDALQFCKEECEEKAS